MLEGLTLPTAVFSELEKILGVIVGGIVKASSEQASEGLLYWIMITRYNYEPLTKQLQPTIRVVSFKVTADASKYATNKANYTGVNFDMVHTRYQCKPNVKILKTIAESLNQELITNGGKLVAPKTTDINVPV